MKTKWMALIITFVFALGMMAQTATQAAPAAPAAGDKASACSCCTGDKCPMGKDGKMAKGESCCGEGCCKDGKCNMAAHKGHTMANGKPCCGEGCCKDGKCNMAANQDGKGGCCGDKCPMMKGEKSTAKSSGKVTAAARRPRQRRAAPREQPAARADTCLAAVATKWLPNTNESLQGHGRIRASFFLVLRGD